MFQEMSSRPTTIVALNVSVAYGGLKGNKSTTADAVRAYCQSDLNAKHPTYVEFPRHLCPREWLHMRRPVCRLIKALYGHPEAGGHWERHLEKIVIALGGAAVSWASSAAALSCRRSLSACGSEHRGAGRAMVISSPRASITGRAQLKSSALTAPGAGGSPRSRPAAPH